MKVTVTRDNSLAARRPDLLAIWDWDRNSELGLDPSVLSVGSNKVAWWKCDRHPDGYDMGIGHRARKNAGCPYCSGKRLVVGMNDLASQYPDIAAEWDYDMNGGLTPSDVFKTSSKKVWWVCSEHGSYRQAIAARTHNGYECTKCGRERTRLARIKPDAGQSLADLHPDLASEWHPSLNGNLTPRDVKAGSNKKVWWMDGFGHEWDAVICSRVSGRGCPYCSGKKLLAGFNDLETVAPEIAREWHPYKNGNRRPSDILAGSRDTVWWLGGCGHEWPATVKNRVTNRTGCPDCYRTTQVSFSEKAVFYYVSQCFGDAVQNAHPEGLDLGKFELDIWVPSINTAIEFDGYYWHNKSPERDTAKDKACESNGIRLFRIRESACVEYGDTTAHVITLDGAGSSALDAAINSLLCELGRGDTLDVDTKRDTIPIMALVKTSRSERSLQEVRPKIAEQWHPTLNGDLTPDMFSYGSNHRAWWVCPKGHEPYQALIAARSRGCGCPLCKNESIRVSKLTPRPGHSLAERFPDIAKEWHPTKNGNLTPENVSYGSRSYMIWWMCPMGHDDYQMLPNSRTASGRGCPECGRRRQAEAAKRMHRKAGTQLQLDFAC